MGYRPKKVKEAKVGSKSVVARRAMGYLRLAADESTSWEERALATQRALDSFKKMPSLSLNPKTIVEIESRSALAIERRPT